MASHDSSQRFHERTVNRDAREMLRRAEDEHIETVWDRLSAQEPQCGFCSLGLSCRICAMGPCRIDPFGDGPQRGVCGADADTMVARNLARMIAAAASAHPDHGRDILEVLHATGAGETGAYHITDVEKLKRLASEYGVSVGGKEPKQVAKDLAWEMMEEYGMRRTRLTFVGRAPKPRQEVWQRLAITPRGIDRESVETLHRTHMGVDNQYVNILLQALRTSLSDGWGGSMIGTELSDVLFGTPQPVRSRVNLGVLKTDEVNIALHGHNPVLSDVIVRASQEPAMLKLATEKGAKGINLVGLCCTGNELMMRRGIPMAGNHLMQELVIMTGALEAMVVDYQCIMPAVVSFDPRKGMEIGSQIVRMGVENFANRNQQRVRIPDSPVDMMAGFSVEAIVKALGGTLEPLVKVIAQGSIRGAVGVVGCNNPKIKQDYGHVTLTRRLIENDILVVVTGCAAVANGKAGHMMPEAADMAGPGLKAVCRSLGIPPVLHMGSGVDNVRILMLAAALADYLKVDIDALPLAGAAPEWYSEKAVSIGAYFVASGIHTVLGVPPPIFGSPNVVNLLSKGLEDVVGAAFSVEPDPERAAVIIRRHIEKKRKG
ncbi:MAG: carbon monoxide dehydrogenase [Chloroflexi bacterium]|nr:carbon monoxide dehydrogenase [Chloroflexota bacterium]